MITVLHEQRETALPAAQAQGEALWLHHDDIEAATGWTLKPEGLCQGNTCVPLPRHAATPILRGEHVDIAALWRHQGHPVAHDAQGEAWVLGTAAAQRGEALRSLQAPDFELPDLEGRLHRLSEYRGKKVFLATWASW